MKDLLTFRLQTDSLSPDILRGERVMFAAGRDPEAGDVAVIDTPAGRLVRRVYFTPQSVTLEAPNAEPQVFRAEAVRFRGTVRAIFRGGRAVCLCDGGGEDED